MRNRLGLYLILVAVLTGCTKPPAAGTEPKAGSGLQKAQLFVELPAFAATPDGMAIAPDGELVLAVPNFAQTSLPACIAKISKDRKVRKWFNVPVLAETGRACPMGIEFGPQGELYVVDNQNWAAGNGSNGEINQGRILRLRIQGDKLVETTVVAKGISHPNGVKYRNGQLFVTVSTLPKVKRPDGLLTSALYRFPADGRNIQVTNTLEDKNLILTFVTENKFVQYGVDGIVFDSQGNLFIGNFGDGKLHKLTLDDKGNITSETVFAKTDLDYSLDPKMPGFLAKATLAKMRTTDGMCVDSHDNIYVADFSNNAIAKVTPAGVISVFAQNPDTGGANGELNEPGEPIVWDGRLIVSNFDAVVGPDKVNTKHESPAKLSEIALE